MNEIAMITELPFSLDSHICQTCWHLYRKVIICEEYRAREIIGSSTDFAGCKCGMLQKEEDAEEKYLYSGIHVVSKCKWYKSAIKPIYEKYIISDEWREKAAARMKKDGFRCVKCGTSINLCVHHLTYDNLGDEPLTDLITLCKKCHRELHGK